MSVNSIQLEEVKVSYPPLEGVSSDDCSSDLSNDMDKIGERICDYNYADSSVLICDNNNFSMTVV